MCNPGSFRTRHECLRGNEVISMAQLTFRPRSCQASLVAWLFALKPQKSMNAIGLCAIRPEINRRASRDPRISMQNGKSYDQQLRNIGQSLEAQRIIVFELSHQGERFVVKGEPEKESSLLATLRKWQKRRRSG